MSTSEQELSVEEVLESLVMEIATDFVANNFSEVPDLEPSRAFAEMERAKEAVEKLGTRTLRETHISVLISFKQLLDYIDKLQEPMKVGDIKDLLQIYMDMARRYYAQFERSLLKDIADQYKTEKEAKRAVEKIKTLQEPDLMTAIEHLDGARRAAAAEYERLLENFPALLQNALDKLRDEWQRLGSIAVASQALTGDEKLIGCLEAVVNVAAHSIGIEAERIVVVPGREFALYFFTYIDDIAVLTVPIYSAEAPWEWSIFWHELAGYKVRRLEKDITLTTIRENLIARHKLLAKVTWDNPYSRNYLQGLFVGDEPDLSDLGSFEHQFERMLANLPKKNKLQIYQQIKDQGWSVNWFEELFEDAWSVLAIGDKFLLFFEDVLRRHPAKDDRHPPMEVRIQVAGELLNLVNPGWDTSGKFKTKRPESIVAEQILRFISLLNAADRKLEVDGADVLELQGFRDKLFRGVSEEIQGAISNWSEKFYNMHHPAETKTSNDPADQARRYAEELINSFSDKEVLAYFRKGFAKDKNEKNRIRPNAEFFEALKDKDYKQLMALSFFERDFFNASGITNVCYRKNLTTGFEIRHLTINAQDITFDAGDFWLSPESEIKFTQSGKTYYTERQIWNKKLPAHKIDG